jgi:HEAT repeat protein
MRARSRFALVGVAGVLIAAAAATYRRQEAAGSGLRCDWRQDNAAAYRVKVDSSATFHEGFVSGDRSLPPRQIALAYEAQLDVRAAQGGEAKHAYVAQMRVLSGFDGREAALKSDLARPFAFEMDGRCRFGQFGFASDEGRESRELKKNLLLIMETTAQPQGKAEAPIWLATQVDAVGEYEVRFSRDPQSGVIARTRLSYTRTQPFSPTVALEAKISKSDGRFLPSAAFWLAEASTKEGLKILSTNGEPFVESTADVSWEATGQGPDAAAAVADLSWEDAHVEETHKLVSSNYDRAGDAPLEASTGTLVDAMSAFADGDFSHGKIDHQAVGNMVHYLRANPAAIGQLLDRIKAGDVDKSLVPFLFFTLTKVGTPEAQRALVDAIHDPEHTEDNRMQAMHALADVDKPLPESVDALIGMAKTFSLEANDENNLESTALLALGVVDRHQVGPDATAKELGKRATETLLDKLKGDLGTQERAVLIEALGNTGNPDVTPVIIDHFNDDSRMVRVSAARALSRMDAPADQAILDAVLHESVADTRDEIARAWAQKGGPAGSFDYDQAVGMLAREPQETIRLSLVAVLGRQAATLPAVKAALAKQFAQETSAKVKYEIGKYLSAADISGGSH